jgi:co-chaperonin GroES (HSP10)
MIPLKDWMVLDIEEKKRTSDLVIPETAVDKTIVDVGDIFIPSALGPDVPSDIKVGDRLLFYGIATVMPVKLPSGKKAWLGRAADVAYKLEEGE